MFRPADMSETIYALCSGALPSAVAVVRVCGTKAFPWAASHFAGFSPQRGMQFGELRGPGEKIDDVILLVFPEPHSLTGENIVEIQCHGSIAVVQRLSESLERVGIRPAKPGEFSYRALSHGKTTPSAIEQLGDLFQARATADLDRIYSRRPENLERDLAWLRERMVRLQAVLDTAIDFSDEYSSVVGQAKPLIQAIIHDLDPVIHRYSLFRSGSSVPRLVLAGRPNAGKSSLFNALMGRYRAIVHERPGTTRDVIEEPVVIAGRSWRLVDTAGFRSATGGIEREGIALGERYLESAAFWVLVVDGTSGWASEDRALCDRFGQTPHLVVWNKSDRPEWRPSDLSDAMVVSVLKGEGLSPLMENLSAKLSALGSRETLPLPTAAEAARLSALRQGLVDLLSELERDTSPEYLAERCRQSLQHLAAVWGEVGVEEVLDRVFNEFCIGK